MIDKQDALYLEFCNIVNLFKQGDGTIQYVCKNYHRPIGWHTVSRILKKGGVEWENPRKKITSAISHKISQMIGKGSNYAQIAEKLNIKYITIKKHCMLNNWHSLNHGNKVVSNDILRKIEEAALLGECATAISNKVDVCRNTVKKICEENNIKLANKISIPLDKNEMIRKIELEGYRFIKLSKDHNKNIVEAIHNKCKRKRKTYYWDYFKYGCKTCNYTGTSKGETGLRDWIESLGFKTNKIKLDRKEIDILIDLGDKQVGIEYCGLYWHSERYISNKKQHYEKTTLCQENNIRLITIFEDEWYNRQRQVKNFLKSVLGVTKKRVYARKCEIRVVDNITAKCFLDDNHIQGKTVLKVAFGLYNDDNLVGLVTGNAHHRQQQDSFVLNRLVFEDGVQVVGGASRLLKYLIKYAKNSGFERLISWSDNRWSEGNVYEKCGFTLDGELGPDYSYTKGGKIRVSKQSNKKSNLLRKGAIGNMKMTERDLALTLGYNRIWDCGKKRWSIDLNNNTGVKNG